MDDDVLKRRQRPPALPVEEAEAVALGMPKCANCGGQNVRLSYSLTVPDRLAKMAGYSPFRCRVCQHRFYKRVPREILDRLGSRKAGKSD